MVRSVTSKYGFWLAGYYDDFLGARAIPDDSNTPNVSSTYVANDSHHGNILNGEANLNPRFRWSVVDRERISTNSPPLISTTTNKYLKNKGSFEFVSNDTIRQKHDKYEGRAQLQYPDGHTNANRSKFGEGTGSGLSGTDINGYQLFCNGYNTIGRYLVSTGPMDATYGRTDMEAYFTSAVTHSNTRYYNKTAGTFNNGAALSGGGITRQTSFANLTGVWQGEALAFTTSTTPTNLFHAVKSPSGKPFLVIQTNADNNNPIISYDGTLNSKLDGDIFTARVCVRSFIGSTIGAGSAPKITFKIGFAATTLTDSRGFTTTPAITYEWFNTKYSSGRAYTYDYFGASFIASGSNANIVNDDCWLDFDFVMDYTNRTYDVYCDGELLHSALSMSGTPTAESMYGWQIENTSAENKSTVYLMVDRVGLIRPLTDHMKETDKISETPIESMNMSLNNNGFSQCTIKIFDDAEDTDSDNQYGELDADYAHNKLKTLFTTANPSDWELLVFGDAEVNRIDRPIWRGVVNRLSISENKGRGITIGATDRVSLLDRQIPVWDIGQESIPTTYGTEVPYWLTETEGYKEMMYLGTKELKLLDKSIGFNSNNNYLEEDNQRMKLYSGIPIQMYNNELTEFGPNNLHDNYGGIEIVGYGKTSTDGSWAGGGDSSSVRSFIEISLKHADTSYSIDSTALKITNSDISSYNTTSNITLKVKADKPSAATWMDYHGNQLLWFDGLTYVPETAKIVLVTNYSGEQYTGSTGMFSFFSYDIFQNNYPTANDATTNTYNFYMDADPSLNIGDFIYLNTMHDDYTDVTASKQLPTVGRGKHKVINVKRIHNYFVDSNVANWFTNYLWVVTTDRPYSFSGYTGSGEKGEYTESTLLSGNDRFSWSKNVGGVLSPSTSTHTLVENRNLHTQWMTDLPKSLWFKYRYGQIRSTALASGQVQSSILANSKFVQITQTLYNTLNVAGKRSGVAEITTSGTTSQTYNYVKFIYKGIGLVSGSPDTYYLIGCQFLNVPITASSSGTATLASVKICDISDDYKHLWLLWADMRNNGQANADGGNRKTNFGLSSPLFENYTPTLYFIDQFKSDGQVDKFTDLKIGEDIVIENVNPVSDVSTTGPMSKPVDYNSAESGALDSNGGALRVTDTSHGLVVGEYVGIFNSLLHDGHYEIVSKDANTFTFEAGTWVNTDGGQTGGLKYAPIIGSEIELVKYRDWEDKGGAFIVIDTSPFFNLNTFINGGKVGQVAGGKTNLVDYNVETKGFPALIDNYYEEATSNYTNVGDEISKHKNQLRILSDATLLSNSLQVGDAGMIVNDLTIFDNSGIGRIIAREKNDGNLNTSDKDYYFTWSNKQTTSYTAGVNTIIAAGGTGVMSGYEYGPSVAVPTGHTEITTDVIDGDKTFIVWGAKPGMMIYRTDNAGVVTKHIIVDVNPYTSGGSTVEDALLVSGTWAATDTWTIPPQLGNIRTIDATAENGFESAISSSSGLEESIANYISSQNISVGSNVNILIKTVDNEADRFTSATVNTTVSNQYALSLMMHLEGKIESENGGTFYDSDKFRSMWLASLMYNWRAPVKLPVIFDINNIPLTRNMSTDGTTTLLDNYGSIFNANAKNLLDITKGVTKLSGFGNTNSNHTTFSWLGGRDGRLSYRPKYNSGVNFDRLNILSSSYSSTVNGQVSNIRVFYNKSKAFVDYPATNLNDSTNWKIIQMPQVLNSLEALKIAQKEYNKNQKANIKVKLEPRQDNYLEDTVTVNVADKMLHTGRYGYLADPYIAFHGSDDLSGSNPAYWTRLGTGGALFTGAQSGLDGNMKTSTDIYNRYGETKYVQVNTLVTDIEWDDNFYWYGAKSLSYAVQIVDVANRCPLVSEKTGQEMRMFVAIKPNQTGVSIDDLVFTVYMVDYAYSDTKDRTTLNLASTTSTTTGTATEHYGSVDVKGNGFHEIPIPKSYWANDGSISGAKIVISVNTDYCRALLRHRCGDPTHANIVRNGNSLANINISANGSGGDYNISSIFPLGGKVFPEWYMFSAPRNEWYAPRLHICKDMKYHPATYVTYTDKSLDLTNEVMTIDRISWNVKQQHESVTLDLLSDESQNTSTVESYLFSSANNPIFQPIPAPVYIVPTSENTTSVSTVTPSNNIQSTTTPSTEPSGSTGLLFTQENNINNFTPASYGNLTNRIGLGDDNSSFSEFSIPGQIKPNAIPSSRRGIDAQIDFNPTGGTVIKTNTGISFPGVGVLEGEGLADTPVNITTASLKIKIPNDVKTNEVNLTSQVTHALNQASSNVAELTIKVTCDQTAQVKSQVISISSNLNNNYTSLFSDKIIGAEIAGNTLTVEIKRVAGSTNDSSDYNSVILSDTQIKLDRVSGHSRASTNSFTTYS